MKTEKKYYFTCWRCKTLIPKMIKEPLNRVFCPDCAKQHEKEQEVKKLKYAKLKAELMHERALTILENQNANLFKYQEASEAIEEKLDRFDSSDEIVAAMELIRNRIRVKIQPQIGRYRPDFILPDMKVVLEIDGHTHEFKKKKDSKRDIDIKQQLGEEWEVIRIPTKYIEENIKALPKAIRELRKYKKAK